MKTKLAILASGRGSNFTALLENSRKEGAKFEVGLLISDKEEAPALQRAKDEGLPARLLRPADFASKADYERAMVRIIKEESCHLVCLAGYMRILSPVFLQEWAGDVINIHPSLLPSFPGLEAQKQALDYGVKYSGCTVHFVDEGMDTGKIIAQRVVPVLETDTVESLSERILAEEHKVYSEVVNNFRRRQDDEESLIERIR